MSKKIIKAFHDKELDKILKDLELFEEFEKGSLKCFICNKIITRENLGCIFPHEGNVEFCCNDLVCYDQVLELRRDKN